MPVDTTSNADLTRSGDQAQLQNRRGLGSCFGTVTVGILTDPPEPRGSLGSGRASQHQEAAKALPSAKQSLFLKESEESGAACHAWSSCSPRAASERILRSSWSSGVSVSTWFRPSVRPYFAKATVATVSETNIVCKTNQNCLVTCCTRVRGLHAQALSRHVGEPSEAVLSAVSGVSTNAPKRPDNGTTLSLPAGRLSK